jgi:hypothetical protein
MSLPVSPGGTVSGRDAQTPRPTDEQHNQSFEPSQLQESASPSPVAGTTAPERDDRKSFSSLSTRSAGSLSTSYSSADEHSEVGELPNDAGLSNEVRIQMERASSGHGEAGHHVEKGDQEDGSVDKLEHQLAGLDVEHGEATENDEAQQEGDDAYLDDSLVQYTIELHDYTVSRMYRMSYPLLTLYSQQKRMYIEARQMHEKLQLERSRGGKGGRSGSKSR